MRREVVLAVLVVAIVSAGCGQPPASSPGPSSVLPSDRAGAPVIAAPRDLASRATDPCGALLSRSQLSSLGYDERGSFRLTAAGSPNCTWRDDDSDRRVAAAVVLRGDLFVSTYRSPSLPIFRPIDIDGLPAVDTRSSSGSLTCTTTVGVADGESLDITASVGFGSGAVPASDPCEEGHRVAEAIVSTLPPK